MNLRPRLPTICCSVALCLLATLTAPGAESVNSDLPDVFSEDLARFERLAKSPSEHLRISAARGLSALGHRRAEPALIVLLRDRSAAVRQEAAFALGRVGGRRAMDALIDSLEDADSRVRAQAERTLVRLTLWQLPDSDRGRKAAWAALWKERSVPERESVLLADLKFPERRRAAFRELALLGGAATEAGLLRLPTTLQLDRSDIASLLATLERVAGPRSIPFLASAVPHFPAAAWALGNVGGQAAERALLDGLRRAGRPDLNILVNLDRLHSGALYPFAPVLLKAFGLVSYRSLPDDLHLDPTPLQRVASRLLHRTGKAGEIVQLILAKLDGKPRPDATELSAEARAVVLLLDRMDDELKAGFHRADGYAHAQPLAALPHLVSDPALAPRLVALLEHPALVVRVYAATALCRLRVPEAVDALVPILEDKYPFPDASTQVSGKHGPGVSGTVRWKGYLAMALGWEASDTARRALETLVVASEAPRDIRYGAAVGLRRIADPRSRPVLEQARSQDIVRSVREEAEAALRAIALAQVRPRKSPAAKGVSRESEE